MEAIKKLIGKRVIVRAHGAGVFYGTLNEVDKDSFTVAEFVRLTKDAYGGEVIRQLAARCLIDV